MHTLKSLGVIVVTIGGLLAMPHLVPGRATTSIADAHRVVVPATPMATAMVNLASLGIAELTPDEGAAMATLHLRAVIRNLADDRPWALDVTRARLAMADGAPVGATFVNAELATLPVVILERGEHALIDFYFALPAELARRGPASFALSWPMNTPAGTIVQAWFDRDTAVARDHDDLGPAPGAGPDWWVDPGYPWSTYLHRPGYAVPRPPREVRVTRSPSWGPLRALGDDARPALECDQW